MEASLKINGKIYKVLPSSVPIDTTLNHYIRNHAKLTGTKFMCLEGGCGVCVVSAKGIHPVSGKHETWSMNSCLTKIYSCDGLDITTVEGLGSKKFGMHKIQLRLANFNGTQCGFCSSGMVMNMHSLMESKNEKVTMKEVENSFGGNICRCTGYRPILDAFKSLATDADQILLDAVKDIEDLNEIKKCPKTGTPCQGTCSSFKQKSLCFGFGEDKEWHKVLNVKEIFEIFNKIGDKPYMLVAGNTAHGVYRRPQNLQIFIDITSVEVLRDHKIGDSLELGGNVNLTETMEIFAKAASENNKFKYLEELIKHIDLVAHVPVRNSGTIAGNLSIKHQHREFPSDIFLIMETAGAKITIADSDSTSSEHSLTEYLELDMNKKIIKKVSLPQIDPNKFIYKSYKIMPRAQNAHAYVNAGFLVEFDEPKNKVASAKICFGGINPETVHAVNTEKYLIGKDLYSNETLQGTFKIIHEEINPDWVLPDASPEYRKNLALSLFYKFVLNTAPSERVSSRFLSGGEILSRRISSGTQSFDTYKKNWPLTKNIPKIEANVQCTGEAKYVNDFPELPGQLYGAFVLATKVNVDLQGFDSDDALKIPGVVAFYSAKDIPGYNSFMPKDYLFVNEPEEIFCSSKIKFHSQAVGMVVANSQELAQKASKLVKVFYTEELKSQKIFPTIKEIFDNKAEEKLQVLDEFCQAGEGFKEEVSQKITGRFEIGGQYHFYMEPQTCVCNPVEDGIDVFSATQWIDLTQAAIAQSLGIPDNSINMNVRRLGGGFGGKISRSNQVACAAALAAHLLNRPVRFIMSLEANMSVIGKRYGCISDYQVSVDNNGKILNLKNEYAEDYGSASNEPAYLTTPFFSNCYESKGWKVTAKMALTDAPSNTWCRGPGTLEGIAMIENIMEHIAYTMGKDPLEIRLANLKQESEMRKILPDFVESVEYKKRKNEIEKFNAQNRWTKKGIAIQVSKFHIEYFGSTNATVSVYLNDGSVSLSHGGIEMGQGLNTKIVQTAAHTLGIPLEKISVKPTNNHMAPNAIVTGGSIGSEINCFAIKKACEQLLQRLEPVKKEFSKLSWESLIKKAYEKNINLSSSYFYKPSDLKEYQVWGVACCEVEVDILTGNLLIPRVDIWEDVGESMSPGVDVGQIEGAFVMGLGYWLTEELIYSRENGELLTNRTWNYKPPGAKDIPIDFRIKFLQNSSNPFGVLRSKAVGEPAICLSIVSIFALRNALQSARKDSGLNKKFCVLGAPTTVEKTFLAANNKFENYVLN